MPNDYDLTATVTWDRLRRGVAGPHIDKYLEWLIVHGFKPVGIRQKLLALAGWAQVFFQLKLPHDAHAAFRCCSA